MAKVIDLDAEGNGLVLDHMGHPVLVACMSPCSRKYLCSDRFITSNLSFAYYLRWGKSQPLEKYPKIAQQSTQGTELASK